MKKLTYLIPALLLLGGVSAYAQTVNDADRHEIVEKLGNKLVEVYPFPEISKQYKDALTKNEAAGRYNNLSEDELASRLTEDLSKAHKDVHLRIMRNVDTYKNLTEPREGGGGGRNSEAESQRKSNYGFKSVQIDGATSTAYVDIPGPFYGSQEAFETAAAAMNMSANSKNIILDIRHNPGGTGQMGRFLASYFYFPGQEQFYLNGFYKDRKMDEQEWTYSYVPGKRLTNTSVYILVGPGTASASEGFAYAMQKLRRATIVGETTAGAGIAGTFVALKNNLVVFTPFKMVVAPNSNVGWEGTGVIPDVVSGKEDALAVARRLILQNMASNGSDSTQKEAAQWILDDGVFATKKATDLKSKYGELVGKYTNNVTVTYAKGNLTWNRNEPRKPAESFIIKELKPDVLVITGLNSNIGPNSSRAYINRDAQGKFISITRKTMMNNGSIYVGPQPLTKL
ncbi:hypothetical protein GCM10023149_05060 [Mucilaginibacter gynuensis]|uniref:Tail specific protease domain-containing protein n=1 Tax=Mucilaginibacter gynuensis TaxID=1302236 RepID=A0ABP8FT57_9SPHI